MAERRISILIDTKGDVTGINQVTNALSGMEGQSSQLFAALKAGVAIDIGGRLVNGLAQVPATFERAIDRGVQFNAVLETSALGIAAVMKQFDTTGKFKTFDDALAASASAIELLKQKAKESPATFQALVQSYQALSGPMTAANIPMEKQVELIVNMSQALSGLGISSQQLLQETRALVTGNINADAAAAKILGVTAADVNGAKQRGELYEFLSGKISSFAEAGKRGANTYQTAASNLEDAIDDVLAKVTKPIFEAMTKGTLDLSAALNDPAIVASLRDIGEGIASLVKSGYDLTQFAIANRDALIFLAKAATALGVAYTAVNITHLLIGLGLKVTALVKSTFAIEAETAALARNTAAQVANGAARAIGGSAGPAYGRAAVAAGPNLARAANLGRYAGALPTVAAGAAPAAAGAGVTAGGIAVVLAPLVIAAIAGWFIRAQINATAATRDRAINDQGNRYGADTANNVKAMAAMVTSADKLAVFDRLQTQEAQAQQDIYEAIGAGDAQRLQMAEQQLKFIALQRGQIDAVFDRVHAINGVEAERLKLLKETEAFLKASLADRDDRVKRLPETQDAYDDVRMRTATDKEKLDILDARRAALPSDSAVGKMRASIADMPAGLDRDSAKQALLEVETKILAVTQQRAEVEGDIVKKVADQAQQLADQQQARAAYILEVQIAEARAKGLDQVADRLENEKKLREEIRSIVEATGASEAEAERAARRKLSAEWQLEQKGKAGAAAPASVPASSAPQPETISIYDNRAVGRLREADANGRIPLIPAPVSISSVVPRVGRPAGSTAVNPGAGDVGTLGDAVADARKAFDADGTIENRKRLVDELAKLTATLNTKVARDDATIAKLIADVQQLQSQTANRSGR